MLAKKEELMEKYKLAVRLDIAIPGEEPVAQVFTNEGNDLGAILERLIGWAEDVRDDLEREGL